LCDELSEAAGLNVSDEVPSLADSLEDRLTRDQSDERSLAGYLPLDGMVLDV
jgi:hypothetical protein